MTGNADSRTSAPRLVPETGDGSDSCLREHSARGNGVDWSVLMAQAQDGDRDAYRRLLHDISPYVRHLAARRLSSREDIEDVLQDVVLTVHQVRHSYDPGRPFGPWLVTIANRRIADRLRRLARTRGREAELTSHHETFAAPETNNVETASTGRVVRAAIDGLPPSQRRAIDLLKIQEMSMKEAAAVSGMSVSALKGATHRAMKNLRRILSGKGDAL